MGKLTLGKNVYIHQGAWVGEAGEHRNHDIRDNSKCGNVSIGDNTVVRECARIQASIFEFQTEVGTDCLIMAGAHVGHDAVLGDYVTVSPNAVIGGHCIIEFGANIGMNAGIHQRIRVGRGAMIGMGAMVVKHVPPSMKVAGVPAKFIGWNNLNHITKPYAYKVIEDNLIKCQEWVKENKLEKGSYIEWV